MPFCVIFVNVLLEEKESFSQFLRDEEMTIKQDGHPNEFDGKDHT